jgi:hypothetical protein
MVLSEHGCEHDLVYSEHFKGSLGVRAHCQQPHSVVRWKVLVGIRTFSFSPWETAMKVQKISCVGSTGCLKSDLEQTKHEPDPLGSLFFHHAFLDFRLVSLKLHGALLVFVIVPSLRSTRQEYSIGEKGDSRHEHASSALA